MTTRQERLTALKNAVTEWADLEVNQLEDDAAFLRSVVTARTGSGRLTDNITEFVSVLTEEEVNAFLEES